MYQTSRSQRIFWTEKRKELQKQRRAENIKQVVKQGGSPKGYKKIIDLHNRFLFVAGLIKAPASAKTEI